MCFSQVNGCNLQSGSFKMRADRAAGTEKCAVQVSMCAGTWRPQSRFSPALSEHCRALWNAKKARLNAWKVLAFPLENSGLDR